MSAGEIWWMSAQELLEAYRAKDLSPVEVAEAVLERIDEKNPAVNAIVTVTPHLALEQARKSEKAYLGGEARLLEGVPVTIKDLVVTKGIRTTMGSLLFKDYIPDTDAVLVERLEAAGTVMLGKTNVPEFGLVAVTDNELFGPTYNPWDTAKTAGGSSGGAAAGLAAGFGPLAVGNDGGGSIRVPASLCGVVGLKPHFGRVPSYPHVTHGWETMNHEGPMARTVRDAAMMLDVMAGPDERDRTSLPASRAVYLDAVDMDVEGLKVAFTTDLAVTAVDPEVRQKVTEAARVFQDELGCDVVEDQPSIPDMSGDLTTLVIAETVAANRDRLQEAKEKIYRHYLPFLELENAFSAADVAQVYFRREELWDKVWPFFQRHDVLLTPTTACPAFDFKEGGMLGPESVDGVEATPASWVGFTFPFNFTGQPAVSIPCGFTSDGLPVGLQIIGRRFDESTVIKAAAAFERVRPWADRKPLL